MFRASVLTLTSFALLSCALCSSALAGHRPDVRRVVFSPDNTRVLAVSNWTEDGSGFASASFSLLDSASGMVIRKTTARSEGVLTVEQVTARLLANNASRFSQNGVTSTVTNKPRYLAPKPKLAPQWTEGLGAGQSKTQNIFLWSKEVPVTLSVKASSAGCTGAGKAMLPAGTVPATFSIDVNGQTLPTPKLPVCAARFALDRLDLSGNRVLITVRAYAPGFEGPNAMPVYVASLLR